MKKFGILLITMMVATVAAMAQFPSRKNSQPQPAATVDCSVVMKSAKEGKLVVKFAIGKGWHVYGFDVTDGPRPMVFDLEASTGVKFTGQPTPSVAPKREVDDMFGVEVAYWDSAVTFEVPFKVTDKKTANIAGTISYQGCNNETCTMPQKVKVDIPAY